MTKDQALKNKVKPSEVSISEGSKFVGAVFLYLFSAIAITAVTMFGLGFLFSRVLSIEAENTYLAILIAAIILYIPILIAVQISALRNGKAVKPLFIIYSIIMGFLLSPLALFEGYFEIIAMSFGVTCLVFGLMALIAWNTKKNISMLGFVGITLLFGAMLLSLFNVILGLIMSEFMGLTWIISFAIFFAIILITIADLNNVKRIAMSGGAGTNIAILCALNLYVDFIYIFIRILRIVASLKSR